MAKNKWMAKLLDLEGVPDGSNPHHSVLRSPSPSVNFIFGNGHGLPFGYSVALWGPPGGGKCQKFDSKLVNPDTGAVMTLQEFCEKKIKNVMSFNPETQKIEKRTVSDWIDSGDKPIVRLQTRLGTYIETTDEHPYYTLEGWKKVSELKVGDKVAIPRSLPVFGSLTLSEDRAYILGSLISDGGMSQDHMIWTKQDPTTRNRMVSAVYNEFGIVAKEHDEYLALTVDKGQKNPLLDWVREIGINTLSKNKVLPKFVMQLDKVSMANVIAALFTGDGSAYDDTIEYSSASETLVEQVQHLLLRFGINAYKRFKLAFYYDDNGERREFDHWTLSVCGVDEFRKFLQFNIIGPKKDYIDSFIEENEHTVSHNSLNFLSSTLWDKVRSKAEAKGLTLTDVWRKLNPIKALERDSNGKLHRHHFHLQQDMSLRMLSRINEILKDEELGNTIDSDVHFVEIVSKESKGVAKCYDLTVPGTNSFVSNDIVAHNTVLSNSVIGQLHRDHDEAIAIKFDTEFREDGQLTSETAVLYGVDKSRYIPYDVNSPALIFDRIEKEINEMCQDGAPIKLIVIDSVNGIQGRRAMNADTIMTQQIGDHALTIKEGCKRILPIQRKHKIAIIWTVHVAAEMDMQAQMRGEKEKMSAGFGLQHHCEYFIKVEQNKAKAGRQDLLGNALVDDANTDMLENSDRSGHKIRVQMKKSSMGPAGRTGEFTLDYQRGIVNVHEEVFVLGYNRGVITREGNKYAFGDRSYLGKPQFLEALKSDLEFQAKIVTELKRRDLQGDYAAQDRESAKLVEV